MDADKEAHLSSCIRGYHINDVIWTEYNSRRGVAVCKRSWKHEGQICNLLPTRFRCSGATYLKRFLELIQAVTGISCNMVLSCDKHHTHLITAKVSNHKNRVHTVKTRYMVV